MGLTTISYVLIALSLLLMAGHSVYLSRSRQFLLLDPLNVFWGGFVVVYILQALEFGRALSETHPRWTLEWTLFWVFIAELGVIIGYESSLGIKLARHWPQLPAQYRSGRVQFAALTMLAMGLYQYSVLAATSGGLDEWLSVGRGATDWTEVSGYVATLDMFLPIGGMVLMLDAYTRPARQLQRLLSWVVAAALLLWYVYLGSRSRVLMVVLGVASAYYLPRRSNPRLVFAVPGFFALIILSNFLAQNRGNFTGLSFNIEGDQLPSLVENAAPGMREEEANGKSSELDCVMTVVDLVPEHVAFNYGYSLLEIATRPIPRVLWPDKIYPGLDAVYPIFFEGGLSNWWIDTPSGPRLAGPALTYVGYWFSALGPIALAIAGYATGALFRALRALYDTQDGLGVILLYSLLLRIPFGDAIGTPLTWIFNLPIALLGLVVVIWLTQDKRAVTSAVP